MAKTPTYRVSASFTKLSDSALNDFAIAVSAGLTKNVIIFKDPPVMPAALDTLQQAFAKAIAAAAQGGKQATAAKNTARGALLEALRKDAAYVQIMCNNDLTTLLGSGYNASSTNRTPTILPKVEIVSVKNGQTGEIKVRVKTVPNAKSFDGRIKQATGSEFGPSITFQNSKSILFKGLTAGVNYVLQICAVGGTTGTSDWSDPVSHMAM